MPGSNCTDYTRQLNSWRPLGEGQRAEIVGLVRKDAEGWVESDQPGDRIRGITLLGGLRLPEAVPVAERLLRDRTQTGTVGRSGRPSAEVYGVQKAAALALLRLRGREAIPAIEHERAAANWHMKEELAEVLRKEAP